MSELTDLQIRFLEDLLKRKAPVAIYLKNGIKLKGTICGFDKDCVILDKPSMQLIQINAISTIAPLLTFETFSSAE